MAGVEAGSAGAAPRRACAGLRIRPRALEFDRDENQGSVAMARTPVRSMTTNSTASAIGPWRSNHSAMAISRRPWLACRVGHQYRGAHQVRQHGQYEHVAGAEQHHEERIREDLSVSGAALRS